MLARADALIGEARRHMQTFQIHLYVAAVFEVVAETNRYFANAEPWKLAKTDPARMRLVLYVTIETLRIAAILLQPVMPGSMGKLLDLSASRPSARPSPRSRRGRRPDGSTRRIGSSRAGRCLRPRRSFRGTSSPRRPAREAHRQPLPSRLSRFRRRARRGRRARARSRRRGA